MKVDSIFPVEESIRDDWQYLLSRGLGYTSTGSKVTPRIMEQLLGSPKAVFSITFSREAKEKYSLLGRSIIVGETVRLYYHRFLFYFANYTDLKECYQCLSGDSVGFLLQSLRAHWPRKSHAWLMVHNLARALSSTWPASVENLRIALWE